jgi:hypothetical protein
MHIVDCRTTNHPPLTVLYVLSLPSPNLWEISKNENSKTMRNIQEWEIVIGKVPQTTNYNFQQRLLHNALTTGHYNNLWTRGKEWKKKKRFIALCIIFHMVFGLLCTNCLHDRLVTKVKTQPWLRGSSTTQLQGGTPLPHAMGEAAALTHVENPDLFIWGSLKTL